MKHLFKHFLSPSSIFFIHHSQKLLTDRTEEREKMIKKERKLWTFKKKKWYGQRTYLWSHNSSRRRSRIAILMISLLLAYLFERTSSSSPSKKPSGTCTVSSRIIFCSPRQSETAGGCFQSSTAYPHRCTHSYIRRYPLPNTLFKRGYVGTITRILFGILREPYGCITLTLNLKLSPNLSFEEILKPIFRG